ncbi:hypothetical protein LIER_11976 [Lithospermum erythrorhizon]|uniref:Reverse transcriptase domain-containing protein n=1 Tax=Lithospermum erythrorhizon TaxID=34254 RepID=A0AAV3PSD2_LITER
MWKKKEGENIGSTRSSFKRPTTRARGVKYPHDDPLVIVPVVANFGASQMLVDIGCFVHILFLDAYLKLRLSQAQIRLVATLMIGFIRVVVSSLGGTSHSNSWKESPTSNKDGGVHNCIQDRDYVGGRTCEDDDPEVYVDDMLIKSRKVLDHAWNLRETFENIRKYQLQLNLEKCIFGVTSGNFSSYMVRQKGIEPNLDKKADIVIKKVHLGSLLNCRRGKTNF